MGPVSDQSKELDLVTLERQQSFARLLEENNFPLAAIRMYLGIAPRDPERLDSEMNAAVVKKLADVRTRVIGLAKHLNPDQLSGPMAVELEQILNNWIDEVATTGIAASHASAYLDAGLAYEKLGRDKKALTALLRGLDVDQSLWPQDRQFLGSVLLKLYSLSLAMEKQEDLQIADVAMEKCRELAEVVLTQPKDARNRAWVFARSAMLKEKCGDLKAARELAAIAIRVPFP